MTPLLDPADRRRDDEEGRDAPRFDRRGRRRAEYPKVPTGPDGHPLPLREIACKDCGRYGCLIPFPHDV